MKLLKPRALKAGSKLGIIAASTPINAASSETIERCYQRLRDLGFQVVEAQNCRKVVGHTAGTIKGRVDSLHRFFSDPTIDGILSFWGGHQSHQILEYLNYDLIRAHPKLLMGFSDTTALTIGIHKKAGLITFSGPAGLTFGKPEVPEFTQYYFRKVLMEPSQSLEIKASETYSDNPWYREPEQKMVFTSHAGWKIYRKGKAEGRTLGGNMGTLLLLAGTEFWPNFKNRILFLEEDEGESPQSIDRMLTQLRQMGVFDQISGLVFGRFCRSVRFSDTDSFEMILDDALRGYRFPVITDVDFGHSDPMITIPLGIRCAVDTTAVSLK